MPNTDRPAESNLERYRTIEYREDRGQVTIIQDTEEDHAWVQSDVVVDVEP